MARAWSIGIDEADVRRLLLAVAGGDGGVDADDLAGGVGQRAAGVAGADRGVGLDEAVEVALLGVDRAAERRHDALRHGRAALEGEGVADGDDGVADGDLAGRRTWPGTTPRGVVELEDGDVVGSVAAEHLAERSSPLTWTVTSSAPATTWALVRMWPPASRTMPVPAPSAYAVNGPCWTWTLVVIDTVDGSTASTTAATSMPPPLVAATGTASAAGAAAATAAVSSVARPATYPAAAPAATTARISPRPPPTVAGAGGRGGFGRSVPPARWVAPASAPREGRRPRVQVGWGVTRRGPASGGCERRAGEQRVEHAVERRAAEQPAGAP